MTYYKGNKKGTLAWESGLEFVSNGQHLLYLKDLNRTMKISDDELMENWTLITKEEFDKGYVDESKVDHPSYYQDSSGVECIEVARYRDFNIGNALKYLWRAGLKHEEGISDREKQIEDLNKAIWYINDEIKMLKDGKKEE